MNRRKDYVGIDHFRLAAALLIVAIHTSPLWTVSETGDFILTRIIARVAVPFFMMTSGFFLISEYTCGNQKLKEFVKKNAVLYGISILIYIPVNLYNGYFSMKNLMPNIIKDLVFDGTFYHLWYLPASIMGAVIAWYLVKRLSYDRAFAVALILYIIGLFGDSYYGIIENIAFLKNFYGLIFQISDYTRNGIFFAPVFFVLGGWLSDHNREVSVSRCAGGLCLSFLLMFAEGMLLHHFGVQRHDSMYLFLLPCMFFLFLLLLHFRGGRRKGCRMAALIIYIIHPMMIVVVRLTAKVLHLEKLLVENSLIQYGLVCLLSVAFGFAAAAVTGKYGIGRKKCSSDTGRAWIEINLNNLEHNVNVLREAMPPKCELMAVLKAEAYGHGSFAVSAHLSRIGVRAFAVATIDEGIKLRKYGVKGEILILGYTDVSRAPELKKNDLTQTLIDFEYAMSLNRQGIGVKTHIKIDTGMHRLGIASGDVQKVKIIFSMKYIKVCGIHTHLCCADSLLSQDIAFTTEQINRFYALIDALKKNGITIPKLHIQSSYGLLNYPELKCDYVRAGIALYGVLSAPGDRTVLKPDLRPVLSLKARVALIRDIDKGESVGYGRRFQAKRDSRIAILPIGYGDGFPRNLSCEKGYVVIGGQRLPVIGRICMDQLAVDITDAENVCVGDTAILIGTEKSEKLPAPSVADASGSISNELLCRMGARLPVVVKEE